METISLIVPCFNEEDVLPLLYAELKKLTDSMLNFNFEFLFVDDGSEDGTLNLIKNLVKEDERVRFISFSRNFGKESAIYAGLSSASGDYVALLDADLQDPPALISEMIPFLLSGEYDCVATRRIDRKGEPPVRSFFARLFYKIVNRVSKTEFVDGARDFRLMNRSFVNAVLSLDEYARFSKGIFSWVGFKTKWISYENVGRAAGKTKWSFWRLVIYSLECIMSFSTAPITATTFLGIAFCVLAILIIVIKTLIFGDPVDGWPTLACFIFLTSGIQLLAISVIGQYIAKTFLETKKRPLYITKETNIR